MTTLHHAEANCATREATTRAQWAGVFLCGDGATGRPLVDSIAQLPAMGTHRQSRLADGLRCSSEPTADEEFSLGLSDTLARTLVGEGVLTGETSG
jgi:hypothetical protein